MVLLSINRKIVNVSVILNFSPLDFLFCKKTEWAIKKKFCRS